MGNQEKRKKYYIDHNFQTKFILKFSVTTILSSILFCAIVYYLTQNSTTVAIENTKVLVKQTSDFILPLLLCTLAVVAFFSALVVLYLTLVISHRISGSAFRLAADIEKVRNGDLDAKFELREKDQLKKLAENLKDMTQLLKERQESLSSEFNRLGVFLKERDFMVTGKDRAEMIQQVKKIENKLIIFKKNA